MERIMAGIRKHSRNFIILGLLVLLLLVGLNSYSIKKISSGIDSITDKNKEAEKPAIVEITLVNPTNCAKCSTLREELDSLKLLNIEIGKENTVSGNDAERLISKYSIKKLPAIVVTGQVEKLSMEGFRKADDALVAEASFPPYQDAITKQVKGTVRATVINAPDCKECPNMTILLNGLEGSNVVFSERTMLDADDAKDLIQQYNVSVLPALVMSSEFNEYEFSNNWNQLGHIASDGSYVLDLANPPFYDLATKKIFGLVGFTGIYDKTCTECYNLSEVHVPILLRFGVWINSGKTLDVNDAEAKALIAKYKIVSVPTVVLSKEAGDYKNLANAWLPVGTVESDGTFVFRSNDVLGLGYKDLASGQTVKPVQQNA